MSSILDALDKLDTATTPVGGTLRAVHLPRRRRSLGGLGAAALAVVGGAALVGVAGWSWSTEDDVPVAAASPEAVAVLEQPLRKPAAVRPPRGDERGAQRAALRAEAPLAGVADDEMPWAEPTPTPEDMPAPEPALPRLAVARVTTAAEPVVSDVAPLEYAAAAPEPPPHDLSDLDPQDPPLAPPRSRPPAGAPDVRLSFLMYSSAAERRTVALTVGNGALASLHEGETAEGFEVVQIHRDHAELRFGGERFDIWPRD